MATGTLIAESLAVPSTLGVPLTVTEIERVAAVGVSDAQRDAGIPEAWTLLHFSIDDALAPELSSALAGALDRVGWYADLHTASESFVVFAGRVFRYARGDADGRAAAEAHAREVGVPHAQIDWP